MFQMLPWKITALLSFHFPYKHAICVYLNRIHVEIEKTEIDMHKIIAYDKTNTVLKI